MIVLLFALVLVFSPYLLNMAQAILSGNGLQLEDIFLIKNDWTAQHISFYQEFFHLLESGELGWSWNQFLGTNFYAAKAYYMVGDPFAYLAYGLYRVCDSIPNSLFAVTFLKMFVSGMLFSLWLKEHDVQHSIRIICSVLFMLSGWVTTFIEHPIFLSFYCIAPLLLFACEQVLKYRRYGWVIFSSTLLLMINYYFTWMLCVFLLIYWIMRYWEIHDEFIIKEFFVDSFKMLGAFLVGVFISAVIWLPSLKHLMLSPRLSGQEIATYYVWELEDFLMIIKNFFFPVMIYEDMVYRSIWYYFYQIGIYCGTITLLVIPQFFVSENINKKTKISLGVLLGVLLVLLLAPQFGKIFHFTYSLRYTMLLMMVMLLITSITLSKSKCYNLKVLKGSFLVAVLTFGFIGFVYPFIKSKIGSLEVKYAVFTLLFICINALCIYKLKNKFSYSVLMASVFVEACLMGYGAIDSQAIGALASADYLVNKEDYLEAYNALKEYDSTIYRVSLADFYNNEGLYYDIQTVSTYDSVYQYSLRDFLHFQRMYPDVTWSFTINDPIMFELCNVKYVIVPENSVTEYYQYIGERVYLPLSDDSLYVYRLNNEASFGRSFHSFVSERAVFEIANNEAEHYVFEVIDLMKENLVVDDELVTEFTEKYAATEHTSIEPEIFENNYIKFRTDLTQDSIFLLSMAYDPGWYVDVDGEKYELLSVHGGLAGIELSEGSHVVTMKFSVPGLKTGMAMSGLGILTSVVVIFFEIRKNKKR